MNYNEHIAWLETMISEYLETLDHADGDEWYDSYFGFANGVLVSGYGETPFLEWAKERCQDAKCQLEKCRETST